VIYFVVQASRVITNNNYQPYSDGGNTLIIADALDSVSSFLRT
jgi:hypothetical protein